MKIAIQGHPFRGKEVIQILESLGGKNIEGLKGTCETFYYIDNRNEIDDNHKSNFLPDYKLYTLEEFEKEFPFKIGDNVQIEINNIICLATITDIVNIGKYKVKYPSGNIGILDKKYINIYNEMNTKNITLTIDNAKEKYKKGGELREIALQAFTEKELNPLPKSWEEFCENYPIQDHEAFINYINSNITICKECAGSGLGIWMRKPEKDRCKCVSKKSAEAHLAMIQLEQLRNCWWNGWKPEYNCGTKYIIKWDKDDLIVATSGRIRAFLIFPTCKMAKEFLECFRDLIKKAGDLI